MGYVMCGNLQDRTAKPACWVRNTIPCRVVYSCIYLIFVVWCILTTSIKLMWVSTTYFNIQVLTCTKLVSAVVQMYKCLCCACLSHHWKSLEWDLVSVVTPDTLRDLPWSPVYLTALYLSRERDQLFVITAHTDTHSMLCRTYILHTADKFLMVFSMSRIDYGDRIGLCLLLFRPYDAKRKKMWSSGQLFRACWPSPEELTTTSLSGITGL